MTSNTIVPIAELGGRQLQTHGRIRLGDRSGTNRSPKSLSTFRFTSADEEAIREIAELYGGTVTPWNEPSANPPNQTQVYTTSREIRVFLPPGALSCWYECWSGGGCIRRCDGISVEITQRQGDDSETAQVPCLCVQENKRVCDPHTRLSVILPEIRFGGVWRMETKGWHAAQELPSMEALIGQLQQYGIVEGVLSLERAQSQGGRKKFVIPRLRLATSAMALLAGEGQHGALHSGHEGVRALNPGLVSPVPQEAVEPVVVTEWFDDQDDVVVDAVLVDESADDGEVTKGGPPPQGDGEGKVPSRPSEQEGAGAPAAPSPSTKGNGLNRQETKLILSVKDAAEVSGIDETVLRHALCRKASQGRTESSRKCDGTERGMVIEWASAVTEGVTVVTLDTETPPKVTLRKVDG